MNDFLSAIQFLTILPAGRTVAFNPQGIIPWFPAAGIVLGIILVLCDAFMARFWAVPAASLLCVALLVVLTGAFHLDGLGDTADGLFSHRPKEIQLEIMKDSRIGIMALAAVVCSLAVKWCGIMSLTDHRALFLLLIPAYSRGSMIFGIKCLDYGRPEGGTGHDFFEKSLSLRAFAGFVPLVVLSLFGGWAGIRLNLSFIAIVGLVILYYKKKMGCITGDMLGAMAEVTESMLFLSVSAGMSV